jgi:hypothetical protein
VTIVVPPPETGLNVLIPVTCPGPIGFLGFVVPVPPFDVGFVVEIGFKTFNELKLAFLNDFELLVVGVLNLNELNLLPPDEFEWLLLPPFLAWAVAVLRLAAKIAISMVFVMDMVKTPLAKQVVNFWSGPRGPFPPSLTPMSGPVTVTPKNLPISPKGRENRPFSRVPCRAQGAGG